MALLTLCLVVLELDWFWKIALPHDLCILVSSYGVLMELPSSWVFSEVCFWMKKRESFFPFFSSLFLFFF